MYQQTDNIIRKIELPYLDKILISKKRMPLFFVSEDYIGRGKREIPKTYLKKFSFNDKGILIKNDGSPVIANPRVAGKPRYWVINFQNIWNQSLTKQARASYVLKMKEELKELKNIEPIKEEEYPIKTYVELHAMKHNVDCSNRSAIFLKVIEDSLQEYGVIINDKMPYVNSNGFKLINVDKEEDQKLIIYLLKSDNLPYENN